RAGGGEAVPRCLNDGAGGRAAGAAEDLAQACAYSMFPGFGDEAAIEDGLGGGVGPGEGGGEDGGLASVQEPVPDGVVLAGVGARPVPVLGAGQGAGAVSDENGP